MDILKEYLASAAEIIGERGPGEEEYDGEVIRCLEGGKPLKEAIAQANAKFPDEALVVEDALLPDLQAHYDYLREHERILRSLKGRVSF
jgi:hypothetical protein